MTRQAEAFKTWKRTEDLNKADRIASFYLKTINKNIIPGRNFDGTKFREQPFLDDLAFLIKGFIDLYQITFSEQLLRAALQMTKYTLANFRDEDTGLFFLASNRHNSLQGDILELADNVIASANSVMATNLHLLGYLTSREEFISQSGEMLGKMISRLRRNPVFFSNWANLLLDFVFPVVEITIVGPDYLDWLRDLMSEPHPGLIFNGGSGTTGPETLINKYLEGATLGFVCINRTCLVPLKSTSEIRNFLYV